MISNGEHNILKQQLGMMVLDGHGIYHVIMPHPCWPNRHHNLLAQPTTQLDKDIKVLLTEADATLSWLPKIKNLADRFSTQTSVTCKCLLKINCSAYSAQRMHSAHAFCLHCFSSLRRACNFLLHLFGNRNNKITSDPVL